jgi:hypothetical protein
MDMLHPRSHYALMATEEGVRSRLRERALLDQLQGSAEATRSTPERRGRWIVASLVSLFTPDRLFGSEPRTQEE